MLFQLGEGLYWVWIAPGAFSFDFLEILLNNFGRALYRSKGLNPLFPTTPRTPRSAQPFSRYRPIFAQNFDFGVFCVSPALPLLPLIYSACPLSSWVLWHILDDLQSLRLTAVPDLWQLGQED